MPEPSSQGAVGRLKSRPQFLAVRAGEKLKGGLFLIEMLDRKMPEEPARVGFTVTKKQGNAVERNRMKRQLREAVRLAGRFAMQPGHDYVIVGRRDLLDASFAAIAANMTARLERAHRPKSDKPKG